MNCQLRDCPTGGSACYPTALEIIREAGQLRFRFTADHAAFFCPHGGYNENHYEGDVCEVFIGTGPDRHQYYEIEVTPDNALFLAKVTYQGKKENGDPITRLDMIPEESCFVRSAVEKSDNRYVAEIIIDLDKLGREDLFFNAYRIETDGGERDKHLFALNPTLEPRFHVPERFIAL